jgi:hypothetical protein
VASEQREAAIRALTRAAFGPYAEIMEPITGTLAFTEGYKQPGLVSEVETLRAMSRKLNKAAQDNQAAIGQPPPGMGKPIDAAAASARRAELVEQYNQGQLDRARGMELYGAERGLNDATAGGRITDSEEKAMKPVASAAQQFNINYAKLSTNMESIIREMLARINQSDAQIARLAQELRNTRGILAEQRNQ